MFLTLFRRLPLCVPFVGAGGGSVLLSTLSPLSKLACLLVGADWLIVRAVYSFGWIPPGPPAPGAPSFGAGTSVFDTHVCSSIGVGLKIIIYSLFVRKKNFFKNYSKSLHPPTHPLNVEISGISIIQRIFVRKATVYQ